MDNVLIVDDDAQLLFIMKEYMKKFKLKFSLYTAEDGLAAIKALQTRPFQLVVTDIQMPRVNGLVLLSYVHTNFPDTSCIVMTGFGSVLLENQVVAGEAQYIEKPFHLPELADMILKSLQVREQFSGKVTGISLNSFLMLIEMEYLTCVAEITAKDGHKGYLYFFNGTLYNAYDGVKRGEEAALNLLRLGNVQIKFKNPATAKNIQRHIQKDIVTLIEEATFA